MHRFLPSSRSWSRARPLAAGCLAATLLACGGGFDDLPSASGSVTVSGLNGGSVLVVGHVDVNGKVAQSTSVTANGAYEASLPASAPYEVRVLNQPPGQNCTVTGGSGSTGVSCVNLPA